MSEDNVLRFKVFQDPEGSYDNWTTEDKYMERGFAELFIAFEEGKKVIAEVIDYNNELMAETACIGCGLFKYGKYAEYQGLCFKWREGCGDGITDYYIYMMDDGLRGIEFRYY